MTIFDDITAWQNNTPIAYEDKLPVVVIRPSHPEDKGKTRVTLQYPDGREDSWTGDTYNEMGGLIIGVNPDDPEKDPHFWLIPTLDTLVGLPGRRPGGTIVNFRPGNYPDGKPVRWGGYISRSGESHDYSLEMKIVHDPRVSVDLSSPTED